MQKLFNKTVWKGLAYIFAFLLAFSITVACVLETFRTPVDMALGTVSEITVADENDEKVNNGEFFIWYDGTKYKMSRAMNSLVTTTEGKQEGYQTIKIVDIMDMIYDDVRTTAQDSYIGKYANTYDNKCLLITAITGYLKELENEGLLQANYSTVELDTEAIKNYQLQNGLYTKDELADMSNDEINMLDTKKKVFLKGKIKIIDAMEDIELPFDI